MTPHAQAVWSALEFRKPMLFRNVEPLGEDQMCWHSPLPCIGWPPYDQDLRLRDEDDLGSGFIIDRSIAAVGN